MSQDPEIIDVTPIEPESDVEALPAQVAASREGFWVGVVEESPETRDALQGSEDLGFDE